VLNVAIANNKATLDGTVGGKRIVVIADTVSSIAAGLFREVQLTSDRRRVEFGDIVLSDNTVTGLAASGGAVYFSAQVNGTDPASSEGTLTDGSPRTPSGPQPLLFERFKCARLKLRFNEYQNLINSSEDQQADPDQQGYLDGLEGQYNAMNCDRFYGGI
jgi:hypothetical protein